MSAIVGIRHLDSRPVDRTVLERMVYHVAPWPAEAHGCWVDGGVGLGHRMLHAAPESLSEKIPFSYDGRLVITADARIDNREELSAKLSLVNGRRSTVTDSELISMSYDKWGERCPEHLLGDFAFAIWDKLGRKLFCARDPMAVKPFFYYHSERLFVFASSLSGLLQDMEVPRKLNELRLAYFLARIYDDDVITFYRDIVRLPAGHCLVVENRRTRMRRYWTLDPEREIRLGSNQEYEEAMREVFFESVRCRLRSDFPIGSMLSGGLDSSSIVCTAQNCFQENGKRPLHTFSAIFPKRAELDCRIDERKYISPMSHLDGIVHHDVIADCGSPLLDILWSGAEPIPAPNFYMDWLIFRAARDEGIRVLLSGLDGDTTVSYGYELFAHLARTGRWLKLFREIKAAGNLLGWPFQGVLRVLCLRPLIPESLLTMRRIILRRSPPPLFKGLKLNQAFGARVGLEEHLQLMQERERKAWRCSPRQTHMNHITAGMMSNMMDMIRVAADDSSIDLRFPYFDRRLIEFCLALPLDQKFQNGESRSIMRRAMNNLLPPVVRSRFGKGSLSVNFNMGLAEHEEGAMREVLANNRDLIEQYINVEDVKRSFERFIDDPFPNSEAPFNLFLVVTLVQWLKQSGVTM